MLHNNNHSYIVSEVSYNHQLDVYDVLYFGGKVTSYADESVAIEHSMTLRNAYACGRKDVIHLLDEGVVTLEKLVQTELELESMQKRPNPLSLIQEYKPGETVELIPEDFLGLTKDYTEDDIL